MFRGLYFKTLYIWNEGETDRFRNKLVLFCYYQSLSAALTNTLAYYRIRKLQIINVL
jgi:hypothetical protein